MVPGPTDSHEALLREFVVHVPLVLFLLWVFGLTLDYQPPVMPPAP